MDYSYDDNDRLLTESGYSYTYDHNGNMLTKSGNGENWQLEYNAPNQVICANISRPQGASIIDYAYDCDGIRIGKTIDGTDMIQYVVDKNRPYAQVLEEEHLSGGLSAVTSYVYGDALISATIDGTLTQYYHTDGMGSVRGLSDAAGVMTDRYSYDAYGMLFDSSGASANPYRYRGEQYDADLDAYYLRARYYQPGTGRFLTTDPVEGFVNSPYSQHRYLYGNDNPVHNLDPSGEFSLSETLMTVGIVGNLVTIGGSYVFPSWENFLGDLGEYILPDSFLIGYNVDIAPGIASAVNDLLGITLNLNGSIEVVMNISSAEIGFWSVRPDLPNDHPLPPSGGIKDAESGSISFSAYRGLIWNQWNMEDYKGPFVSFTAGDFSVFASPSGGTQGAWGMSQSFSIYNDPKRSSSMLLSTAFTYYQAICEPWRYSHEGEVAFIALTTSVVFETIVSAIYFDNFDNFVNMGLRVGLNATLWMQTYRAKTIWNKRSGYTVEKRQNSASRPPDFQSGPSFAALSIAQM